MHGSHMFNTYRLGQNGQNFTNDYCPLFLLKETFCISIKLPFINLSRGTIENVSAMSLMMAWHRTCNKPFLTHWGRVTHICVGKLTNIGSDNGLSPERRQAIIWTNAGILVIGPLGTNFSEFLMVIHIFSFNKMHLKISSAIWRPFVSASMC